MNIEDGGKTRIHCSNCNEPLVDVWVTRPSQKITTEMTVQCSLCGDKSFKHSFEGRYHLGNIGGGKVRYSNFRTKLFDKKGKEVSHTDFTEEIKQIVLVETMNVRS